MKAAVILQKCTKAHKTFGIRVEEREDGEWYKTWAFPIDDAQAQREGYQNTQIVSMLPNTEDYPGCPYCGCKTAIYDSNCGGKLSCYYGGSTATCGWCGVTYDELGSATGKLKYTGGNY